MALQDKLQKISTLIKEGLVHLERIQKDLDLLEGLKQDLLDQINEQVNASMEDLKLELDDIKVELEDIKVEIEGNSEVLNVSEASNVEPEVL